jgi:hypothetical protein
MEVPVVNVNLKKEKIKALILTAESITTPINTPFHTFLIFFGVCQ